MTIIQDLFDPSKQLNRKIESVVTFGASTEQDLKTEIGEYVVTQKLHDNYDRVISALQDAFNDGSKEVGIWVSGFYGSGKSSFAKYLGLSFNTSLMIDGATFGQLLLNRMNDQALATQHNAVIKRHNPVVIMIDLSTQQNAGRQMKVSEIVYFETLKQLGLAQSTDLKVNAFLGLLRDKGKYDEFCRIVESECNTKWEDAVKNDLEAQMIAAEVAPKILPTIFRSSDAFYNVKLESSESLEERFQRLYTFISEKTNHKNVIFVLDEVGQYIAADQSLILDMQGMMQILKDKFRGKVWVVGTAQQTLTEDDPNAQLNSSQLYKLNDRFPLKIKIEADDIKEIITRRLLGKSSEGKTYLIDLFKRHEAVLKHNILLTLQQRSIYTQLTDGETFANLYPFLPVHIDILMQLLHKLASRTGGVGLRSVIRLIRDILVENRLADAVIGRLAGPDSFYDVLHSDMDQGATKEIVQSADNAIRRLSGDELSVRICKTIAVMQILDDFNLNFDNLAALLYNKVGGEADKTVLRDKLNAVMDMDGITLQEVDGRFRFMSSAILSVREERGKYIPREIEKSNALCEAVKEIFTTAPAVNVYRFLTKHWALDLSEGNKQYSVFKQNELSLIVRFVSASDYDAEKKNLLTKSTLPENSLKAFWLCALSKDKNAPLLEIVRSKAIAQRYQNDQNKEVLAYVKAQEDYANAKMRELVSILREAFSNGEIFFRGSPKSVTLDNYLNAGLKETTEKIYEKYPLAAANMKANSVEAIAQFTDLKTVPVSLNPLEIIDTKEGIVKPDHPAFTEVKDYVNKTGDASGSDIISIFEREPYGWSKDTTRYVLALMLKASLVQFRVQGRDFKTLSKDAAAHLANTTNFNKVTFSLNTSRQLSLPELLKAVTTLKTLFNSSVAPVIDQIAAEALKRAKAMIESAKVTRDNFNSLKLAGAAKVADAVRYLERIIESDGADAPQLLAQNDDCMSALKYVLDFQKTDKNTSLVTKLRHIAKIIDETKKLQPVPQLADYRGAIAAHEAKLTELKNHDAIHQIASDVADLKDKVNYAVDEACVTFVTSANELLHDKCRDVFMSPQFNTLSEEQQDDLHARVDKVLISESDHTIDGLSEMVQAFTARYIPGGELSRFESVFAEMLRANLPTPAPQPDPATKSSPHCVKAKANISSRQDLQDLINELSRYLDVVNESDPVKIDIF